MNDRFVIDSPVEGRTGSRIWTLKSAPELAACLAKLDWNQMGRRVSIDAPSGIVSWMIPSVSHEGMSRGAEEVVVLAGRILGTDPQKFGSTRWKRPEDPSGTGHEPDASFYIGETATAFRRAWEEDPALGQAFAEASPPDLVVEVDDTYADPEKPIKYARLGIPEMWRGIIDGKGRLSSVDILDLQASHGPISISISRVLPGLAASLLPEACKLAFLARQGDLEDILRAEIRPSAGSVPEDDGSGF